jgi:hypothetical protein
MLSALSLSLLMLNALVRPATDDYTFYCTCKIIIARVAFSLTDGPFCRRRCPSTVLA